MNLEKELLNQAARQMARDIDTEILMTAMNWKSLELSKGTVYGTEYLTVHPSNSSAWNEMMVWMIEQFGPSTEYGHLICVGMLTMLNFGSATKQTY
jgi:hypothetical protein